MLTSLKMQVASFFTRKPKKFKSTNSLSKQKPLRKRAKTYSKWYLYGFALMVILGFCFPAFNSLLQLAYDHPRLSFIDEPIRIDADTKAKMVKYIEELLYADKYLSLGELAVNIQSRFQLAGFSITRTGVSDLVLKAIHREPFLLVQLDKLRATTADGIVYGEFTQASPEASKLALLTLPLGSIRSLRVTRDGGVSLPKSIHDNLLDGINLYKLLSSSQLHTRQITYEEYRGFSFTLGESTNVYIGQSPFDYRVSRLKETLKTLASNGRKAARIELDYQGKAFIKEETF